ncbi:Endoplasmic reticulum lectin 1 [Fasciolopsis buskii]|uniref:Endoplasmic reticulum lectin 1 n=1 Tax=Fasciolopsis buskii TaxID=27845 RepID=A0A8E0RZ82_9TREM|nr:Endoplasmic reticulum lectin 1 [Fasciolopsis buski]
MKFLVVSFVFLIVFFTSDGETGSEVDNVLYKIVWNPDFEVKNPHPILVSTALGEKYECDIPTGAPVSKNGDKEIDKTVDEVQLLEEVFSREPCAVRTEFYWTYELCHKKHIRQYHEEFKPDKTVSSRQEYFLGYLDKSSIGTPNSPESSPERISLGEYAYPYFRVNFTMGDVCDLTQQHRVAAVLYICFDEIDGQIVEVAEVESCRYQVIFATRHLCRHPAYRRQHKTVNSIPCRPRDDSPVKPIGLTALENEYKGLSAKGFSNLAALFESGTLGKIRVEAERKHNTVIYHIRSTAEDDNQVTLLYCILSFAA